MTEERKKKWQTVDFPTGLFQRVKKKIDKEGSGYTSVSDYIRAATREKLERETDLD